MTATLTDGEALLRAVLDPKNFGDDGLRLAYADLLEEDGQGERAEFVRVQLRLAADSGRERVCRETCKPPDFAGCPQKALRRRERELLGPNWEAWAPRFWPGGSPVFCETLWPSPPPPGPWVSFRRSFVEAVSLPCADFLRHGPRLVRLCPLREVRLTDREPYRDSAHGGWYWYAPGSLARHEVPAELVPAFSAVVRASKTGAALGDTAIFTDEGEASAALPRACLLWARNTEPTP